MVLFTTSPSKVEDGRRLGAHEVVISKDEAAMEKHARSFDFILDCVSATHDVNAYLKLLQLDGTLVLVGAPERPLPVEAFHLLLPRRNFAGSAIGGIARDAGDAGLLREVPHHARHRDDPDPEDQRGLRTDC